MPEPTATATATLAASAVSIQTITLFGIQLGLRPEVLVAGFSGAVVAIVLLNSVPSEGDTWRHLLRTSWRRMAVAAASSLTAGYLAPPMAPLLAALFTPEAGLGSGAFVIGAGAQAIVALMVKRTTGKVGEA